MSALPPDCEAALAQLDAFRRGELPTNELASMQRHLDACRHCLAQHHHEKALLDRLANATRNCICPDELRASITQMVNEAARDR